MIGIILEFAGDYIEVRVNGNDLTFRNSQYGSSFYPLSSLTLSKSGVEKEFPDLVNNKDWRELALARFRDKLASYGTEDAKVKYVIDDLKKYGYVPKAIQKQGWRSIKVYA